MCYSSMRRSRSSAFGSFNFLRMHAYFCSIVGASVVLRECAYFGVIVPIVVAFVFVCGFSFVLVNLFSFTEASLICSF